MHFVIPGKLPTMNEIIEASKSHYHVYRKMKKEATERVMVACWRLPKLKTPVNFVIIYYCHDRTFNKDNIAAGKKFIFDGMQAAHLIKNDGWKEIGDWQEQFKVDKKNPRIEVIIKER